MISRAPGPRTFQEPASHGVVADSSPRLQRARSTHREALGRQQGAPFGCAGGESRYDIQADARPRQVSRARRRSPQHSPSFKVTWTFLNGDYLDVGGLRATSGSQAKRHAPRWRASQPKRTGVRLGPHYPRDSTVLQLAAPKIIPMSKDQFARAVEILAEMLADRMEAEGDSPSTRLVIRRIRV
jgi:hypothetical protein